MIIQEKIEKLALMASEIFDVAAGERSYITHYPSLQ